MRKLRHSTCWLLAALLLLGLLGWVVFASRPAASGSTAPKLAVVTFLNYSNAPDGRVFAWFCITNPTDTKILHFRPRVVGRFGSELYSLHLLDPQSAPQLNGPWVLPPHARIWVSVVKPANEMGWSASVMNGVPKSGLKTLIAKICQRLPLISKAFSQYICDNTGTTFYPSTSEPRTD